MVLSTARRVLVGARVGPVRVDGVVSSLIRGTVADRLLPSRALWFDTWVLAGIANAGFLVAAFGAGVDDIAFAASDA